MTLASDFESHGDGRHQPKVLFLPTSFDPEFGPYFTFNLNLAVAWIQEEDIIIAYPA